MRKHLEAEFLEFVEHCGLSPDKPEDGWKLAHLLYLLCMNRFQPKKKPGVKATTRGIADDVIMMFGIWAARRDGDTRGAIHIIREIAKHNGWRTDEAAIKTKQRRYGYLKDDTSRERQRVVRVLQEELGITQK